MRPTRPASAFARLARATSRAAGRPRAFIVALTVVLAWLVTGPLIDFSHTWQLAINSFTTIVTFLMVFLLQTSQNRDSEAAQVKLDEILRVTPGAHIALLDLEELEERELDRIRAGYEQLAELARKELRKRQPDTGVKDLT